MQSYSSANWRTFRNEVICLDGGACVRCRRTSADGAVLQVHHKAYIRNRKPWEYRYDYCETLCSRCHAEEHGKIPPKFGWEFVGYDDLGDLIGICENCGTSIRHIFLVQHEKWGILEVGEICCDNLTDTQVASDHMDSVRRFSERRKRFVSSTRWIADESGNLSIRQKRIDVKIIRSYESFRFQMNGRNGKLKFGSILDAKMKAFDLIESGKVHEYLKKHHTMLG